MGHTLTLFATVAGVILLVVLFLGLVVDAALVRMGPRRRRSRAPGVGPPHDRARHRRPRSEEHEDHLAA